MAATKIAKPRRLQEGYFDKYFIGEGADIGCGDDPIMPDVIKVDQIYGLDALVPNIEKESLDYVFSSHCLEHLVDPYLAVKNWWDLIKTNGYLIVSVPDWVLYEQRVFPSRFNSDHKWVFSMFGSSSFVKHLILSDLFIKLPNCQILSYRLCDNKFQYTDKTYDRTWFDKAEAEIEIICRKHESNRWL